MFDATFWVGTFAGVLTAVSNFPQALKTWRTQETGDLSTRMLSMLAVGLVMWIAYGFLKGDMFILAANACAATLVIYILIVKVRTGKKTG
jgi:MtN3 and saliva related transmembrane protein